MQREASKNLGPVRRCGRHGGPCGLRWPPIRQRPRPVPGRPSVPAASSPATRHQPEGHARELADVRERGLVAAEQHDWRPQRVRNALRGRPVLCLLRRRFLHDGTRCPTPPKRPSAPSGSRRGFRRGGRWMRGVRTGSMADLLLLRQAFCTMRSMLRPTNEQSPPGQCPTSFHPVRIDGRRSPVGNHRGLPTALSPGLAPADPRTGSCRRSGSVPAEPDRPHLSGSSRRRAVRASDRPQPSRRCRQSPGWFESSHGRGRSGT